MANNDITVDEFVTTKVLPKYQPIVKELRRLIRQMAPSLEEVMSYGIPNYRGKRGVAVISPAKTHITLLSRAAQSLKINMGCWKESETYPRTSGSGI